MIPPFSLNLMSAFLKSLVPEYWIDGIWLSRPYGGISRVWHQILSTLQIPGLLSRECLLLSLDRGSNYDFPSNIYLIKSRYCDPLDYDSLSKLSSENSNIASSISADLFSSTWITYHDNSSSVCPQLAVVHDCIPERFIPSESPLRLARDLLFSNTRHFLAVSRDSAQDIAQFFQISSSSIHWCHPYPFSCSSPSSNHGLLPFAWRELKCRASLPDRFFLLPGTSSIGSYKNPEFFLQAFIQADLDSDIYIVISGIGALHRSTQFKSAFPTLANRIMAFGFTDSELELVYRNALGVIIPSYIGFWPACFGSFIIWRASFNL